MRLEKKVRNLRNRKMGNQQSIEPRHIEIYRKLIQMQSVQTKAQTIHTLLMGPEYVTSAKITGIYPTLLGYISAVQSGRIPGLLPGETPLQQQQQLQPKQQPKPKLDQQLQNYKSVQMNSFQRVAKQSYLEKAKSYFTACLDVLGITDDMELTPETLKKAYNRVVVQVHPDKGGSEEEFQSVTRAYAYLSDISKRLKGGRAAEGLVESPELLTNSREQTATAWKVPEEPSVRLNPKNLNITVFNELFEKNNLPEPDSEGYGDWLKNAEEKSGPKFNGEFNQNVFNRTFENGMRGSELIIKQPEAMTLSPMAVELGRDKPDDFTAPANSHLVYTDLKKAYTTNATFSGEVSGIRVNQRDMKQFEAERKNAPEPLRDEELRNLQAAELQSVQREKARKLRAAQEDTMAEQYFNKMKQYVINN